MTRHMRTARWAAAALTIVALTACGGDSGDGDAVAEAEETTTTTAVETTTTAPPAPPPVGTPQPDDGATLNVLEFAQPVATEAPTPAESGGSPEGYEWAGVHAELCLDPAIGNAVVSHYPWRLAYADGALVEPSSTGYNQFPDPEYPWGETAVAAGQCVRGWIVYAAPPGTRPAVVQYARPGTANITEWTVG